MFQSFLNVVFNNQLFSRICPYRPCKQVPVVEPKMDGKAVSKCLLGDGSGGVKTGWLETKHH